MDGTDAIVLTLLRELDDITVTDRIRQATDLRVQDRIDAALIARIGRCADAAPEQIAARLAELEREWSVERLLALHSSAAAVTGIVLGSVRRRWLLLALVTSGFLMQHAVQGWCPPLALHRRLGFRSRREIELEIHMLKLLRGDYSRLVADQDPARTSVPGRAAVRASGVTRTGVPTLCWHSQRRFFHCAGRPAGSPLPAPCRLRMLPQRCRAGSPAQAHRTAQPSHAIERSAHRAEPTAPILGSLDPWATAVFISGAGPGFLERRVHARRKTRHHDMRLFAHVQVEGESPDIRRS